MEINGYALTYDPIGLDEDYELEHDLQHIPYGETVIYDKGRTRMGYSFDMVLKGDEIEAIIGMISSYHLIHLSYKHLDGWFFVTSLTKSWIKDYNTHRLVSFKVTGVYIGNHHLTIGMYHNYDVTDFNLTPSETVRTPPTTYTSKHTPTVSTTITGTRGNLQVWNDPTTLCHFMATKYIFNTGLNIVQDGSGGERYYTQTSPSGSIDIDNGLFHLYSTISGGTGSLRMYDPTWSNITDITTPSMLCNDNERVVKPGQNKSEIKQRFTDYSVKYGQNYVTAFPKVETLTTDTRRLIIPISPSVTSGTVIKHRTSTTPFPIDTLGYNNSSQEIYNGYSPGHLYYGVGQPQYLVSSNYMTNRPRYTIPVSDYPWYIGTCTSNLTLGNFNDWTKTGTWSAYYDGNSYYGVSDYWRVNEPNLVPYMTKTINISSANQGYHDFWVMAGKRTDDSYDVELMFDLDVGTLQEKATLDDSNDNEACWVYFGPYNLSSGNHTFKLITQQGTNYSAHFYEYLLVPYTNTARNTANNIMMESCTDLNTTYEIV